MKMQGHLCFETTYGVGQWFKLTSESIIGQMGIVRSPIRVTNSKKTENLFSEYIDKSELNQLKAE